MNNYWLIFFKFGNIHAQYYYKFFAKNTSMLTLSEFKQDLAGVTTFPDVLNNLSEAQPVSQTENSFLVNFAREGKV